MKVVHLSVGGKTFVAGEYLALTGGPALMLATDPRFEIQVSKSQGLGENIFHPESPAGKFWSLHRDFFQSFKLHFKDPYQIGGFGASSAQFALLHSLWQLQDQVFVEAERFFDWHLMLQDYRSLGAPGNENGGRGGFAPSGADVVGACTGGLTWFDRQNGKVETFSWPFLEKDFFVAHTGRKLATHEHLQSLAAFETRDFEMAMNRIYSGLSSVDFPQFLSGLNDYRQVLEQQERVAAPTREKVSQLEQIPEVLFAKGCGAMGSDVIFVLCEKSKASFVKERLGQEGLSVTAGTSQISAGLRIENFQSEKELVP